MNGRQSSFSLSEIFRMESLVVNWVVVVEVVVVVVVVAVCG